MIQVEWVQPFRQTFSGTAHLKWDDFGNEIADNLRLPDMAAILWPDTITPECDDY
jgi:hypothetical protein